MTQINAFWPFRSGQRKKSNTQKRFQLRRNFSLVSMIGFAIATILLAAFERQQATKTIVYSTEKHHTALAHVLSTQLFPKYGNFLYSIQALDTQTLIESASMRQISEDIASQIVGSSIVNVKVYDINGRTTLSTDTSQIGRDKSLLSGFLAAKSGQVESQLGHRDTFQAIEETLVDRHLLSTYTPIYDNDDPNKIIGVFDVYTDVTPLMLRIKSTQLNIILGSLLILTVLQTVLYLFVHNADR